MRSKQNGCTWLGPGFLVINIIGATHGQGESLSPGARLYKPQRVPFTTFHSLMNTKKHLENSKRTLKERQKNTQNTRKNTKEHLKTLKEQPLPGGPTLTPLRPYQPAIYRDRANGIVILHWSRQIGKSYTLAANPRTARGFSGDLILDEFAFRELGLATPSFL